MHDYDIGTKISAADDHHILGLCPHGKWIVVNYFKDEFGPGGGQITLADADWDDATHDVTYESSKYRHKVHLRAFVHALDDGKLRIVVPPHPLESLAMCAEDGDV